MSDVQPLCPMCGSENIRSVDRVLVTNPITGWEINAAGKLVPSDFEGGEVWWDTSEAVEYDCGECGHTISLKEIDSLPRKGESPSLPTSIPNDPIARVELYNKRMDELELVPNGDDYNNIFSMLDGHPHHVVSRFG